MINLVVALLDEAKPLIDFYQLKQVHFDPFPIYINNDIRLILSKLGAISSACAVTTLHNLYCTGPGEIWLNIGLAGQGDLEIGQGVLASKIMHNDLQEAFYPAFVFETSLPRYPLKTLMQPSSNYEIGILFDMEGFGFYQAAVRYASLERIHLFKIISDNSKNPLSTFNRNAISPLIHTNISKIDQWINDLKKIASFPLSSPYLAEALTHWRFTQTERCWLEKHLPILNYHEPTFNLETLKGQTSKQLIYHLKQRLKEVPL